MSEHTEHSSSLGFYVAVWATLMVCTGITVGAAFLDLHQFNAAVALTIATFKALLVALFFMHIRGASERLIKLWVLASIFFLVILITLSMADFGTRLWS